MAVDTTRKYQYYKILEVSRQATQAEIDASYRKLANQTHPDKNPDPKAHELFKKINQAYQAIGNSKLRLEYDNSPAECPDCWNYEVIQTVFPYWRCRRCGCQFNPAVPTDIKRFHDVAISEKLRKKLELFSSTQCSFCRKFYTQPFLCPQDNLTSNCMNIEVLTHSERDERLSDTKWHWRMTDMIDQATERGTLTRCRNPQCGALNPNPKARNCWRCKQNSLCCPSCEAATYLSYDLELEKWKCINNSCRKTFAFVQPKKVQPRPELELSEDVCPVDSTNLYFDPLVLLWNCKTCGRTYTYQELHPKPKQAENINIRENIKRENPVQSQSESKPKQETKTEQPRPTSQPVRESSYQNAFCPNCGHETYFNGKRCLSCHKEFAKIPKLKPQYKPKKTFKLSYTFKRSLNYLFLRFYILAVGLIGAFILWVGFLPVLQNHSNQSIFKLWWSAIWSFGDLSDYVRGLAIVIAAALIVGGLFGVLLAPFKRYSATRFIFLGGIAGLALLGALWSGLLDGSEKVLFFMGFGGANAPLYDGLSGGIPKAFSHNLTIIAQIMKYGWFKISLVGFGVWFVGTLPFSTWWRRLR